MEVKYILRQKLLCNEVQKQCTYNSIVYRYTVDIKNSILEVSCWAQLLIFANKILTISSRYFTLTKILIIIFGLI